MNDEDFKKLFANLVSGYWLSQEKAEQLLKKVLECLRKNLKKKKEENEK